MRAGGPRARARAKAQKGGAIDHPREWLSRWHQWPANVSRWPWQALRQWGGRRRACFASLMHSRCVSMHTKMLCGQWENTSANHFGEISAFFAEFHEETKLSQNGLQTRFPTGHAVQRSPLPSVCALISQFTASASSSWGRPSPWAPSHDTRSIRDLRGCRDAGAAMAMLSPTTSTLQPKLSSLNSVWTGGIALAPIMMAHG